MGAWGLEQFEESFSQDIKKLQPERKIKAGVLLPIVPDRLKWDEFTVATRRAWPEWRNDLEKYPACLLLLYAGLAYFEYEDATLWRQFSDTIADAPFSTNLQQKINGAFGKAMHLFGFIPKVNNTGTNYVGSAVHFIGIPLSMWDGFLEICKWALVRPDWRELSDGEWQEVIAKRSGSRTRLRTFLTENRDVTSTLIKEVLDARTTSEDEVGYTINDIAALCFVRPEYFAEVPETAEFLRPKNPDTLIPDKARLVFNEQRRRIYLQLPGIAEDRLPAVWRLGAQKQEASDTPHEIILDAKAFTESLTLTLESKNEDSSQHVQGIGSWSLFDIDNGGSWINSKKDELRLRNYALISAHPLQIIQEGFDESNSASNRPFELKDGTVCYITYLWATKKFAELKVYEPNRFERSIQFRRRQQIEAHFFAGREYKAAYCFFGKDNTIGMDHLPVPCVAIPNGYFRENAVALKEQFSLTINGRNAAGHWKKIDRPSLDSEYWEWIWDRTPWLERREGITKLKSFQELEGAFKAPDLRGKNTIAINIGKYIKMQVDVQIISRHGWKLDRCWQNLPGPFLPLFLLCQYPEGLKWEELLFARDVVAPDLLLTRSNLVKFYKYGFLALQYNRWKLDQSKAVLFLKNQKELRLQFCGDPTKLWGLFRSINTRFKGTKLPVIEVVQRQGQLPYMETAWPKELYQVISAYCRYENITIDSVLWNQ